VSSFVVNSLNSMRTFHDTHWNLPQCPSEGAARHSAFLSISNTQRHRKGQEQGLGRKAHFHDDSSPFPENMPLQGRDGIFDLLNEEHYRSLIQYSMDQNMLVVLKIYAPWCKACKKMAPKFVQMSRIEEYDGIPILWAQLTCKDNKALVQHVLVSIPQSSSLADASPYSRRTLKAAIPSVQLYADGREIFTFPAMPSRMPQLKKKLNTFLENEYVYDTTTENNKVNGGVGAADGAAHTRLFPGGPVTVTTTTSTTSLNGGVDDTFVADAAMTVSTVQQQIPDDDSEPAGWTLELHQPEDLSQPMTVSLQLELTGAFEKKY